MQQYASMGLQRPLTQPDLVALEQRARAGSHVPALDPSLWEQFQDWFCKTVRALKQVCCCQHSAERQGHLSFRSSLNSVPMTTSSFVANA